MRYLIGLDIGTSSVKGVLMTTEGDIIKTARGEFQYTALSNGGLEIEAENFVQICFSTIKELVAASDGKIEGICASSASGNLVIVDQNGKPSTPIYNWQDKRVTTEAKEVLGEIDLDSFYKKVGWAFSYRAFPLALACYIKKHEPEIIQNAGMVTMSTEYLYYRLTGKWGISTSAGTPFYFIDQTKGTYIPEVMDALGITENQLPPIMSYGSILGGVLPELEELSGLPVGTPVILGCFDHPSAARGVGVLKEGEVLLSCGTSWVGFAPVKDRTKAANARVLIDPFLAPQGGPWGAMVSVASISERIWLYVSRYIDDSAQAYQILSELAAKCESGAGGLSICIKDEPDDARLIEYSKEQIARAIMESAVRLLQEQLERIKFLGIDLHTAFMVGGPSSDPVWHQIISEICGISVRVSHGVNAGAVGAARLAGIGVGLYQDEMEALAIG